MMDYIQNELYLSFKKNCSAVQNTQICWSCLENIHKACNFKMLYVKQKTLNVASKIEQINPEISCICQICKEIIKKSLSASYTKELKCVIHHLIDGILTEKYDIDNIVQNSEIQEYGEGEIIQPINGQEAFDITNQYDQSYQYNIQPTDQVLYEELMTDPLELVIDQQVTSDQLLTTDQHVTSMKQKHFGTENVSKRHKIDQLEMVTDQHILKLANLLLRMFGVLISIPDENIIYICIQERMWEVSEEHTNINHLKVSPHFTVDDKNNRKASSPLETYITSNVCDYKAKPKMIFKKHMFMHKNVDKIKMFTCDVCGFKSKRKSSLMLTHKTVDEIKMFTCDVCRYKSKLMGNLKIHMLQHKSIDDIEMFTCNVCGYKSKLKGNLKRHC